MRLGCLNGACLLAALSIASASFAQQPPTIDNLIDRVLDLRKQKAELDKQEAAALAELQAELKKQKDRLDKLNIPGPEPAPGPKPVDPLAAKIKTAIATDKGTREEVLQLAALYHEAAKLAISKDVPSSRELLRRVREASAALVGADVLTSLRTLVAAEVGSILGNPGDAMLTDTQRKATAELFTRLAAILEGL